MPSSEELRVTEDVRGGDEAHELYEEARRVSTSRNEGGTTCMIDVMHAHAAACAFDIG